MPNYKNSRNNSGYNTRRKKPQPPNVVFFDLECTGFDRPIRPVQVDFNSIYNDSKISSNH